MEPLWSWASLVSAIVLPLSSSGKSGSGRYQALFTNATGKSGKAKKKGRGDLLLSAPNVKQAYFVGTGFAMPDIFTIACNAILCYGLPLFSFSFLPIFTEAPDLVMWPSSPF
jgi:hypothetical protein